jgi:peptidoglycan hydrolase-like protein with peptidoglycan-binding domain
MKTLGTTTEQLRSTDSVEVREYLDGGIYQPPAQGIAVQQIQEDLNQILGAGLDVDGIYGPNTADAVRALQREAGVTVDGAVGPETQTVFKNRLAGMVVGPSNPKAPTEQQAAAGRTASGGATRTILLPLFLSGGLGYGAYTLWNQIN